ncbi:MAG: hypothetical protein LBJ61_07325 [Deltaproteobacteria bacterium]|jgi:hypothetical protein|nr:hypothetical protein [Deltaproteobacteria bacterium]
MAGGTPDILEELFLVCAHTGGALEAIEEALLREALSLAGRKLPPEAEGRLAERIAELALMAKEAWICGRGSKVAFEGGLEKRLERVAWADRLLRLLFAGHAGRRPAG